MNNELLQLIEAIETTRGMHAHDSHDADAMKAAVDRLKETLQRDRKGRGSVQ